MIYIINSPVLTNFGSFEYKQSSINEIKLLLRECEFVSAVGHEAAAALLTKLLETPIPLNRIAVYQGIGDIFIVIKPKNRLDINKEYSQTDIENMGYELGLLRRLL